MKIRSFFALVLICSLASTFIACDGDDGGGTTPAQDTVGGEDTVTGQDTAAPEDTTPADDTPPAEDTQVSGTVHPYWANSTWEGFWPSPEESAVYTVTTFSQEEVDVVAKVEEDVEWKGGTWTRILAGDPTPGSVGQTIYLDMSTPWQVAVKGIEVFEVNATDGPTMVEFFDDPLVLPLDGAVGDSYSTETTMHAVYGGSEQDFAVGYEVVMEAYDADIELPFGTLTGCVKVAVTITGDLAGPDGFTVEVIAHPEQRIVKWDDAPGFITLLLKEPWQ